MCLLHHGARPIGDLKIPSILGQVGFWPGWFLAPCRFGHFWPLPPGSLLALPLQHIYIYKWHRCVASVRWLYQKTVLPAHLLCNSIMTSCKHTCWTRLWKRDDEIVKNELRSYNRVVREQGHEEFIYKDEADWRFYLVYLALSLPSTAD